MIPFCILVALLAAAVLWLPAPSAAAQCSVTGHESALFDLTDPILDLADATVRAEDAYARLVSNADPGSESTSVVVEDLERLIDDLFAAGSKLDRNNLDHLHSQERVEREIIDHCIDDHYRARRVASSCADELGEYRRVIRSLVILTEDLIFVIGDADSARADITNNASTLWPTTEARTDVRNEDLDRMDRLIREAKTIRTQLEGEARAERHPRRALYDCIRQTPEYYESSGEGREDSGNTPFVGRDDIRSMQQVLAECGFQPGPADGIWGDRTERAATSFVRAHGGEPAYGDRGRLAEQVGSYLKGDAVPCPGPSDGHAENEPAPVPARVKRTNEPACTVYAYEGREIWTYECWLEVSNIPGCHAFNRYWGVETFTWSGGCESGRLSGNGREVWRRNGSDIFGEGQYVDGKRHGHWVSKWSDGKGEEGPYVDGKKHGRWVETQPDSSGWVGGVEEGPYVDGKRHGHWVSKSSDGQGEEGPYVDGERHGRWVIYHVDKYDCRGRPQKSSEQQYKNDEVVPPTIAEVINSC